MNNQLTNQTLLQEYEKQVHAEMQQVTEYFGEGYDATDPSKVLRVIRDFMHLFDKAVFEIQVSYNCFSCRFVFTRQNVKHKVLAPLRTVQWQQRC